MVWVRVEVQEQRRVSEAFQKDSTLILLAPFFRIRILARPVSPKLALLFGSVEQAMMAAVARRGWVGLAMTLPLNSSQAGFV